VRLRSARAAGNPATPVSDVRFGSLGGTNRATTTEIWLTAGTGSASRFLAVQINPITGLASLGQMTAIDPQALAVGNGS
jgi:hypothetical protein